MNSPSRIGRYHVIGRIASGGMAEILLAKVLGPGGFERPVVIKRVLPHLVNAPEFRDMFLDEARIVAGIHHSNVVQVHELGREDDELYLVMEYLAGESVSSLWKRAAARGVGLDLGLCAHIVAESCAGLHAAHEFTGPDGKSLHVVHRDVCPNNLFVTYDGSVKVVDFGIAQASDRYTLTQAGQVKGKAAYMAPEQCLRRPIDRRTDVFALGVVLYELTTGHRVFGGALESRIVSCLQREQVQPPSRVVPGYPAELERICVRALRLDPAERFASAEEMRRELVRFQRSRAGDVLPEEQLKACMRDLFQERIAEKTELLRCLRAGSGVSHIPTAEVADEISAPIVETDREPRDAADVLAATSTGYDVTRGPARRRRGGRGSMLVSGVVMTCVVAGLASFFLMTDQALDVAGGTLPTLPAETGEPQDLAQAVPIAALPQQVKVELVSQPAGASVWIAEAYRGDTPLILALPRNTEPLAMRLQLLGHDVLERTLVPDLDQRLSLSLSPQKAKKAPRKDAPEAEETVAQAVLVAEDTQDASTAEDALTEAEETPQKKSSPARRRPAKRTAETREEFFLFE